MSLEKSPSRGARKVQNTCVPISDLTERVCLRWEVQGVCAVTAASRLRQLAMELRREPPSPTVDGLRCNGHLAGASALPELENNERTPRLRTEMMAGAPEK